MTGLSTLATKDTPIGRIRPDIEWIAHPDSGRWVAYDPISNAFFYFSMLERSVATMLDGKRTAEDIVRELHRITNRKNLSRTWVEALVFRLAQSELLLPSLNHPLIGHRSPSHRANMFQSALANPLAIRIPLLHPTRLVHAWGSAGEAWMRFVDGLSQRFFSPAMAMLGTVGFIVVMVLLLAKILAHPEQIFYDVARLQGDRWWVLIVLWIAIKSLHELGHYLATVRWRSECSEVGLLLLCFTPCWYCDTTQAWKLPSRWQRAAIAAAGMYVELWIAMLGGIVFLNTQPGLWQTLGAVAFLTCTIGTLLINGNPCFRYDGYYILSDLWGVPNLAVQSRNALWDCFIRALGGKAPQPERFDKPIWQLALFALVSGVYRMVVIVLLAIFLWNTFVPLGLGLLVWFILITMCVGLIFMIGRSASSLQTEMFASTPVRLGRVAILLLVLGIIAYLLAAIPIPRSVHSRGFIDTQFGQSIYAADEGIIREMNWSFERTYDAGEVVFELESTEKSWQWLKARQELELAERRIALLNSSQAVDETSAFELPSLIELRNERKAKLEILNTERDKLVFRAPTRGRFLPTATIVPQPYRDGVIPVRQEHVIQPEHLGLRIERGQPMGWFVPQEDAACIQALVTEREARLLAPGMPAYVVSDSRTEERLPTHVVQIGSAPVEVVPEELMGDSQVAALRDANGSLKPESPSRLVTLHFEERRNPGYLGAKVTVQFVLPGKTVSQWIYEQVTDRLRLD